MNSKTTPILVTLLVIAAFLVGMFWQRIQYLEAGKTPGGQAQQTQQPQAQQPQASPEISQIRDAFSKSLVKFGKADSKLLILEISDPSCPYCQIAGGQNPALNKQVDQQRGTKTFTLVADGGTYVAPVPEIEKLVQSGKAAYAYLYFPGHGNGQMGAKAMYCAFEKGKFWEVQGKLMTADGYTLLNNTVKNDKTKSGDLATFLAPVIDSTFMKSCLDSGKYDAQLGIDQNLGNGLAVSGTPNFFVNATNFGGAYSYTDMESTVQAALK